MSSFKLKWFFIFAGDTTIKNYFVAALLLLQKKDCSQFLMNVGT
jgi:hypothetical protein